MKHQFLFDHKSQFPVELMCRVLDTSPSAFYAWRKRAPSPHTQRDWELGEQIKQVFERSRGRYGSPRVHQELRAGGHRCSPKRVARLMRERGLCAQTKRRFVATTHSKHAHPLAPNVLNRRFGVEEVEGVNRVWAGDITFIPVGGGWLYLAVVLDLKSRRVIGWSMKETLEQELVAQALSMAQQGRLGEATAQTLLFHSDRGSQYAAHATRDWLAQWQIVQSMSGKGDCWDNAVVESFFATLKKELVHREHYHTPEQAKASLFAYIEVFYNRQRRHSALGFQSPHDYEQTLLSISPP